MTAGYSDLQIRSYFFFSADYPNPLFNVLMFQELALKRFHTLFSVKKEHNEGAVLNISRKVAINPQNKERN